MYFPKIDLDMKFDAFSENQITSINLSDYKGKNMIFLFYPHDFTYVCPTELNAISDAKTEFTERNTVVFLISKDSVYSHKAWANTARRFNGVEGVQWPMLSDKNALLSKSLGLFDEEGDRTKRATVFVDSFGEIFHIDVFHMNIGRSIEEMIRIIDALKFVTENGTVCPVNWKN